MNLYSGQFLCMRRSRPPYRGIGCIGGIGRLANTATRHLLPRVAVHATITMSKCWNKQYFRVRIISFFEPLSQFVKPTGWKLTTRLDAVIISCRKFASHFLDENLTNHISRPETCEVMPSNLNPPLLTVVRNRGLGIENSLVF